MPRNPIARALRSPEYRARVIPDKRRNAAKRADADMTACYWVIGRNNKTRSPAVAVDLHDAEGALANPYNESWTATVSSADEAEAVAEAYALSRGVSVLTYDEDSSEISAND